ncbi:MAG: sensor histidine kinase [Bacteroidetes bacterium]|nr:MAG: sensor histidine kinase [Bacteroidota bacterium]
MKLLQQTSFYFLGISFLILVGGVVAMFFVLSYMLDQELDESLKHTREVLNRELAGRDSLPPVLEIMDEKILLHPVGALSEEEVFKDTTLWIEEEESKELEPFRQYIYTERIQGKNYRIALNHSKFETEQLLGTILGLVVGYTAFFLLVINVFNRYLSRRIWSPFFDTIAQMRRFSFSPSHAFVPGNTKIEEFQILDQSLVQMTEKLMKDYQSLKQFSENASHEMQTPLAIIRSQVELLLQQQHAYGMEHLRNIQQAALKLSKLNSSLLMLTRIENRQYTEVEPIRLDQLFLQKIQALEGLLSTKSIEMNPHLAPVTIRANPIMIDILISNLLSNAIKHNFEGGHIAIHLTAGELRMENTGAVLSVSPEKLFERFSKGNEAGRSLGLGLAIVKEICKRYAWEVSYQYANGLHVLLVDLSSSLE